MLGNALRVQNIIYIKKFILQLHSKTLLKYYLYERFIIHLHSYIIKRVKDSLHN